MAGMLPRTSSHYWGTVLDSPDPLGLARFYADLLGWTLGKAEPNWVTVAAEGATTYLGFQRSPDYVRPVWPPRPGEQQMMLHLDIEVGALDEAVTAALAAGATLAEHQPQDDVRVLLDPDGHPFCLYVDQ